MAEPARYLKEKLLIAQRVFDVGTVPALIKQVMPTADEQVIAKYVDRAYKWMEDGGRGTHDDRFFNDLAGALRITKDVRYLMNCSPEDFFNAIPEGQRAHVSKDDLNAILRDRESFLEQLYLDSNSTTERLHEELEHSLSTGKTDQKFLYLDLESVRLWRRLIQDRKYKTYDHCLAALHELLRSTLWKEAVTAGQLDCIVDLGVGAGSKDLEIIKSFAQIAPDRRVRFVIVDTSWPMLEETIKGIRTNFPRRNRLFKVQPCKADFLNLAAYRHEIRGEKSSAFFILGNTFGNVPEATLMRSIQRATQPADLLVIGAEFLDIDTKESTIDEMIQHYDTADLRELATTPIRLRRHDINLETLRRTVRFRPSRPAEFSDLKGSIAVVISIEWKGDELIVAYSNRYADAQFVPFIEDFGFIHKKTFPSPSNPNYRHVVFERTAERTALAARTKESSK